jgi:hypothetical protein
MICYTFFEIAGEP